MFCAVTKVCTVIFRNMEVIGIVGEGGAGGEARGRAWARSMPPPRVLMQRVHIPFTFKLVENLPVSYSGE